MNNNQDKIYELIEYFRQLDEINREHAIATLKTLSAVQSRYEKLIKQSRQ